MLDKLKDLLLGIKFRRPTKHDKPGDEKVSAIYSTWLLVLPLICGLVLGRLTSVGLGYGLERLSGNSGMNDNSVAGVIVNNTQTDEKRGLDEFLAVNPFHISPRKPPVEEQAPKPVVEEAPAPVIETNILDDVILRGTLPGTGAWIEIKGALKLLLTGKNLDKYKLTRVTDRSAVFAYRRERITKYITYGPVVAKKKPEPAPVPAPVSTPVTTRNNNNVVAAVPGVQDGEVPAEVINNLVQNPMDELKRIRIKPDEKNGGLSVQWIQSDSILRSLGVQRGDVIKSVNGIPFNNMGDIANSINSLMNSDRVDVEVTRDGKSTALRYVVR